MSRAVLILFVLLAFWSGNAEAQYVELYPTDNIYNWFERAAIWKNFINNDINILKSNRVKYFTITYSDTSKFLKCEVDKSGRIIKVNIIDFEYTRDYSILFEYDTTLVNKDFIRLEKISIIDSVQRSDNYRKFVCFRYSKDRVVFDYCSSKEAEGLININYFKDSNNVVMHLSNFDEEDYKEYYTIIVNRDNFNRPVKSTLLEENYVMYQNFYYSDSIVTYGPRKSFMLYSIQDNRFLSKKVLFDKEKMEQTYFYSKNGLLDSAIYNHSNDYETKNVTTKYNYEFYK